MGAHSNILFLSDIVHPTSIGISCDFLFRKDMKSQEMSVMIQDSGPGMCVSLIYDTFYVSEADVFSRAHRT